MDLREGANFSEVEKALGAALGGQWVARGLGVDAEPAVVTRMEKNDAGYLRLTGLLLLSEGPEDPISARQVHGVNVAWIESAENTTQGQDLWAEVEAMPNLARRQPDEDQADFSARVARYYRLFAAIYPNPVAEMAAYYNIKAPTLHGWVRDARLRGEDIPRPRTGRKR